eukprot:SAG31_NODE_450_length_15512_cov_5.788555_17_plen_190_part_00
MFHEGDALCVCAETDDAWVILTRDQKLTQTAIELIEQRIEASGTAGDFEGVEQVNSKASLCDAIRFHHESATSAHSDAGSVETMEDDLLAYCLLFFSAGKPDMWASGTEANVQETELDIDAHMHAIPLPERLRFFGTAAQPISLVMDFDWIYLAREDYALYPLHATASPASVASRSAASLILCFLDWLS